MADDRSKDSAPTPGVSGPMESDLASIAFLARSLGDENRLRILLCLGEEKKAVGSIVQELNLSQPLVSHHLKELKRSLLVKIERSGPFVYYQLADSSILRIIGALHLLARELLTRRTSF